MVFLVGGVIERFCAAAEHSREAVVAADSHDWAWLRIVFLPVKDRDAVWRYKPLTCPRKTGRGLPPHFGQFSQMLEGVKIPVSLAFSVV